MLSGLSDHNLIIFSRKRSKHRHTCPSRQKPEKLRIPKGEIENCKLALNNINWDTQLTNEDVNEKCRVLMDVLQETMGQFMRKIKTKQMKKYYPGSMTPYGHS